MGFTVRLEAPSSCVRSVQRRIKTPASSPVGIFCASLVSLAGRYGKSPHLYSYPSAESQASLKLFPIFLHLIMR